MATFKDAVKSTGDHIWSSEYEVGEFIASIIKMSKATNVLETGVFKGRTACHMIKALPAEGKYYGIDIEDLRPKEVQEYMADHNFIIGDSRKEIRHLPRRHFDLIFIDSVHEYEFLSAEFRECERVIKTNGIIILHDAFIPGVRQWAEYLRTIPWFMVTELDTMDQIGQNRGLFVIRCLYGDPQ